MITLYLQKLSTLTIAKQTTSTRTDITLQTSVKKLRAITMCSTFTPYCRYDTNINKLIGDVYCPNTMCSRVLYVHRKIFHSCERSEYQCPQYQSTCQLRNIPSEQQRNSFLLKCDQGIYVFEQTQNFFKMFLAISNVQHVQTKSLFTCQPSKIRLWKKQRLLSRAY